MSTLESAVSFFLSDPSIVKDCHNQLHFKSLLKANACSTGLPADQLVRLSTVVAGGSLGYPLSLFLINCMVPARQVPPKVLIDLLGALCNKRIPLTLKRGILLWIGGVFHLFDRRCNFELLFRVLLLFLDTELVQHSVNILVLLASKKNATHFTLRLIDNSIRRRPSTELSYLASIFNTYKPGFFTTTTMKPMLRDWYEHTWIKHMRTLQHNLLNKMERPFSLYDIGKTVFSPKTDREQAVKTLEYEPIDVLRLLCHGNMDIFFECQLSQDLQWHIDHLVARKLSETFHNPESPEGLVFLEMLVEGAQGLQEGFPAVEKFLFSYLMLWDGVHYFDFVMQLISTISTESPGSFFSSVFYPMKEIFCFSSLQDQKKIFKCLSSVCHFWVLNELPRVRGQKKSFFNRHYQTGTEDIAIAVQECATHLDVLGSKLVLMHPDNLPEVLASILEYYVSWADLHGKTGLLLLQFPTWDVLEPCISLGYLMLLEKVGKIYLSTFHILKTLKVRVGHDQLATKKLQFNEQLSWLVRILTGGTEQVQEDSLASSLGRLIEPPEAAADFALWQHPAIRPAARKLCRSFRIDPEELTENTEVWKKFLDILLKEAPQTARLIRCCASVAEGSKS